MAFKFLKHSIKYIKDKAEKRRYDKSQKEYEKITSAANQKRRKAKAEAEVKAYNDKFKPDSKFKKSKDYKDFVESIYKSHKVK